MRLEVERLTLGYGRRTILAEASLEPLPGGAITALIGPNGAGKSTLLRGRPGCCRRAARCGSMGRRWPGSRWSGGRGPSPTCRRACRRAWR
ncbi:ATP-binding cassette domain-containing protein [Teichococcus aestuarii]|uniref:ATP-binding cassette domain-containing protein n=1 Tax=Teichococcus aestuarii TaxID=568898 RepID=UPI00361134FE